MANYGSGDGTGDEATLVSTNFKTRPFSSPSWTAPGVFEGHQLVTKYGYHPYTARPETTTIGVRDQGGTNTVTQTTKTFHDDLSRARFVVENWQSGYDPTTGVNEVVSGENRTTETKFNGLNQPTQQIAYNNKNGNVEQQITRHFYRDTISATRVTHTIYPDSAETTFGGNDQVRRVYNLDGSLKTLADQRGVIHTYSYNNRRQLGRDSVGFVNVLPGFLDVLDISVLSIGRSYDSYGRSEKITSYDSPHAAGSVVNEIQYQYHATHGKLESTYQEHTGRVDANTPKTTYIYDPSTDGTNAYTNNLRKRNCTYPLVSGGERPSFFGEVNTIDDRLNRANGQYVSDGTLRPGPHLHLCDTVTTEPAVW